MSPYRYTWSLLVCATLAVTCAPTRFTYAPVSTTSADVEGAPAVVYDIPPGAGRGDVRVAMLGLAALRPAGVEDSTLRVLHVALEIRNRSAERWSLDPSEAHLELATEHERMEVYATSARISALPVVDVAPGGHETVHLYFPLPIRLQTERALPSFDVLWTVRLPSRAVTERTSFQRFIAPPPVDPRAGRYPHEL
ncbi:hypothetical protein BH11MYX4_BH11MYX4_13860 [soil metagenome]